MSAAAEAATPLPWDKTEIEVEVELMEDGIDLQFCLWDTELWCGGFVL